VNRHGKSNTQLFCMNFAKKVLDIIAVYCVIFTSACILF
jgi:hypothetical protein